MTSAITQAQQLTEKDKTILSKELVPVIFDQVKQISGIDFLGFAKNPSIENFVNSPFLVPQSALRADNAALTFKPDSIKMDISSFTLEGMPDGILKEAVLKFDNYKTYSSEINGQAVEFILPEKIYIDITAKILIPITFEKAFIFTFTTEDGDGLLPIKKMDAEFVLSDALENLLKSVGLTFETGKLFSFTETKDANGIFNYNMVIEDALKNMLEEETPNLLVKLNMKNAETKGTLEAILVGLPAEGSIKEIPMGDAEVYLSESGTAFADSIIFTTYEEGVLQGYRKQSKKFETLSTSKFLQTTTDSIRTKKTDPWTWSATEFVTANIKLTDTKADLSSILSSNGIFNAILGNWSKDATITFESAADLDGSGIITAEEKVKTMEMILTYTGGGDWNNPINIINLDISALDTEDEEEPTMTKVMNVKATIPLTKENIIIDFSPIVEGEATKMATAYLYSNLKGIVTDNESITIDPANFSITEDGISVENYENARYSIINMQGITYANGRIKSASEFISTTNLPKGAIYVFVINENGINKTLKFLKK
ncbi:T9SS C-terminal target domain-containing protein [Parabacteroides sp. 52]|nr:T9SS C-terminal target domain-containing protein [Parabacteroides sp. 52]